MLYIAQLIVYCFFPLEEESPVLSSPTISSAGPSDYVEGNLEQILEEAEDANKDIPVPANLVKDSVKFLNNLKLIFHSDSCTREKKIQILTLVRRTWSLADTQKHFDASWRMIETAKEISNQGGILDTPAKKQG